MENKRGGNIKNKYLYVFLIIFLLLPASVSGDEEFNTTAPEYLVGDYLEYTGYSEVVINDLKNSVENENQNIQIEVKEETNLKIEISSFEECELEEFTGFCQRAKTNHFVNLSLSWPQNSTNYLNDQMYVLISTNEESLTPQSESPWSWTKRIVVISSIFKTNSNEEQSVETRISKEIITHKMNSEPETISVGDSWVSVENREVITDISQRENYGLWEKSITNNNETLQRIFSANSVDLLNGQLGVIPVMSISEGDVASGNYSIALVDELGFTRKVEKYDNGEVRFSSELIDYRYLRTPDPSAKQSIQSGALCFGIFLITSIIFVGVVFGNEYRKQKGRPVEINQLTDLDHKLKLFKQEKEIKTRKSKNIEENKLKSKLRNYYLKHNPAKLEFLNEIIQKMDDNEFGNSEEHLRLLNMQLIERYGIDLDGNKKIDDEEIELPDSSKRFKEFMNSILED